MKLVVACPQCAKRYQVGVELVGKRVKCRNCEAAIVVTQPQSANTTSVTNAPVKLPPAKAVAVKVAPANLSPADAMPAVARPTPSQPIRLQPGPVRSPAAPAVRAAAGPAADVDSLRSFFDEELSKPLPMMAASKPAPSEAPPMPPPSYKKKAKKSELSGGKHQSFSLKIAASTVMVFISIVAFKYAARTVIREAWHAVFDDSASSTNPAGVTDVSGPAPDAKISPSRTGSVANSPSPVASPSPAYAAKLDEAVAVLQQMADLLAGVTDRASALASVPQFESLGERGKQVGEELRQMEQSGPRTAADNRLATQKIAEMQVINSRISAETMRVQALGMNLRMQEQSDQMAQRQAAMRERTQSMMNRPPGMGAGSNPNQPNPGMSPRQRIENRRGRPQ
jgi:hypothetical protein